MAEVRKWINNKQDGHRSDCANATTVLCPCCLAIGNITMFDLYMTQVVLIQSSSLSPVLKFEHINNHWELNRSWISQFLFEFYEYSLPCHAQE